MKKLLSLLLIAAMALTLFACAAKTGGNESEPPASTPPESQSPADTGNTETPPETGNTPEAPADDDLSYILGKGKIVIGYTDYAPMNYYDESGKLVGFDTEFAEALCQKLGVTPEFKEINWDTKEIELKAKNIDCIWNGLTVKEDRKLNMAFTTSYLSNEQVVVIRTADADKLTTLDSLKDALLVAEDKSAGADAITTGLPGAAFTPVISQAMALLEVKAGTADAAVIDYTMARAMTGEGSDYSDLMFVTTINMMPEEYAIGLRLGSTAVARFNEIIIDLKSDGTLSALADKYDVSDLLITT